MNAMSKLLHYLETALVAILAIAPLGILTIKGWSGHLLAFASLLALVIMLLQQDKTQRDKLNAWVKLSIWMFIFPVLGILISQALRQDWHLKTYDAPSRFMMALPIFWVIYQRRLTPMSWWKISVPLSLLTLPILTPFLPQTGWTIVDSSRFGTYFVDPLTFGRITIAMACLSFLAIKFTPKHQWPIILLQIVGGLIGVYYSIKSGSRTGWLAVPLTIFIYITFFTFKNKLLAVLLALLVTTTTTTFFYQTSANIHKRIETAIREITNYSLSTTSPQNDTSVGLRVSFIRMGYYYFSQAPLTGYDDKGFEKIMAAPEVSQFHSEFAKKFALTTGFHNELITNSVRAGIWGFIYTILLFFTPLILAITLIRNNDSSFPGHFGLIYSIHEVIASMSTEVFNLKFTAAFYALLIACILGQSINQLSSRHESR
jgi:O-antigen ligase